MIHNIWVERKPTEISASMVEKLENGRGWKTANRRCSRHKYIKLIARERRPLWKAG